MKRSCFMISSSLASIFFAMKLFSRYWRGST
ncbi:hypothetical protein BAE44_0010833 [Dichanthelium oligosanthes]|uniref:Uncharacterized protein n=1 Tax=Dichanthelium oligosanthes TaxID=888268 RepID=A0A1E5VSP1_9POAL|nr:hypothetical protein BAE44_0010833 [Dichanthelium oligosanthes]